MKEEIKWMKSRKVSPDAKLVLYKSTWMHAKKNTHIFQESERCQIIEKQNKYLTDRLIEVANGKHSNYARLS